ncbi:MAG: 50S ribosomal protein L18 [Kiritimatiellia bacterium]|jgi:large subunit ribosomal protein L18
MKVHNRLDYLKRRHLRIRKKIVGSAACPRMSVSVSRRHMCVQFLDDSSGRTIVACATVQTPNAGHNLQTAKKLGARAAEAAKACGITKVVFDRGGHAYHGRVKEIADAAREAGIKL